MRTGLPYVEGQLIEGCEVPAYRVPVNAFVAEHPIAGQTVAGETRIHTGELEAADLSDKEVDLQFKLLAGSCNDILLHAADEDLKTNAFESVIETVVRLQNPQYATEQIEVRREAIRLHDKFVRVKAQMLNAGIFIDKLDTLEDPSKVLLQDFTEHITGTYDLREMRENATRTLEPMIKPVVLDDFEEIAAAIVHADQDGAERRHGDVVRHDSARAGIGTVATAHSVMSLS